MIQNFFLPKEWTDDIKRCEDADVPENRYEHKTKPELALEIVRRQRDIGTRFDYVCADGLYGNSIDFCKALDDDNEIFLLHVHAIYLLLNDDEVLYLFNFSKLCVLSVSKP